jgi:predicted O-linked N-acetylglucosamine transferase (SPINDLY family)
MVIGRYRWEKREYDAAYKFIRLADSASQSLGIENTCTAVSLATMLHPFPNSTQQADSMMDRYVKTAEAFLQNYKNPKLNEKQLSQTVAGAGEDPYVHCALSIFHLSFYYRADMAKAANLHHQVVARVWPQLTYQSPKFPAKAATMKVCTAATKKIKLGIASGFLTPQSSVAADFMGVLQRLDRNVFDVTYIHFCANSGNVTDQFVYHHEEDKVLLLSKTLADQENGAWVTRYHKHVETLDLDILLYLDLTMSPHATRVAMARLARVQATTHGHPVTSGIPSVDYYISWGAAELETAQSHYSEKLVLLDATGPHQYYEMRHNNNDRSVIDGGNYNAIAQRSTFDSVPKDGNWYTCMQKPHKFMPEMDDLVCGVLQNDQQGRVILHRADSLMVQKSFEKRLQRAGCDMQRVHFLPAQPHHKLLALYAVSTVILDSYPAGGCTTTREALELGKAVVTLPGRLLGGRWSYAYYQVIGDDTLISSVVASTPEEYITKAVALGQDKDLREKIEVAITSNLYRLYGQKSAVASWESALLRISPTERKEICS